MPPKNTDQNTPQQAPTESTGIPPQPIKTGLHTYAGDMAQTLRDQKGSLIKIAIAEQNKREQIAEDVSPETPKNKLYLLGGGMLILIAIALTVFVSISRNSAIEATQTQKAPSLVFADSQKEINTTDLTLDKVFISIQNELQSTTLRLDTIEQLYFSSGEGETKTILGTQGFFNLLKSSAPDKLKRALGMTFMLGVHAYNGNQAFMLFTTTSREDAFAGMLAWETKLFDDLYQVFGIDATGDKNYLFSARFEDAIIKNKDARVIRDQNGKVVLLYLFPTDNTLIIANGENALQEVWNRLQNLKETR